MVNACRSNAGRWSQCDTVQTIARRLSVTLAPIVESFQHRTECLAFIGEQILVTGRMTLIETRRYHALCLERLQSRRQCIWRNAGETLLECLKPQWSLAEEVAKDQQRPFLADHVERHRYRAFLLAVSAFHVGSITQ